ncbi:MAG: phosphotransferase [Niabella sp.]
MHNILKRFGIGAEGCEVVPFGSGLINSTWDVKDASGRYILQKVNDAIFQKPEDIAHNIELIRNYLSEHYPSYYFVSPVTADNGSTILKEDGAYYRVFPFVKDSHSIDVVQTPDQAYEAARQFGKFTSVLKGLDVTQLRVTLPSFHDLSLRYEQFQESLETGNQSRIAESAALIEQLLSFSPIVEEFEELKRSGKLKLRPTHHDTKISNVLFDNNDKTICVIDLDTVMPGYFISDVGDMMRTYLSPVSEEESDFSKIVIRDDFYRAILDGYLSEMKNDLTEEEKERFFYAGQYMIYMQALRFLTDHLNDDVYYGAKYPNHNLIRAQNQLTLLQRLSEKENVLNKI